MIFARLVLLGLSVLLSQAPAAGRASLQGQVVESGTTRAVSGAHIVAARLGGALNEYRTVTTDAAGRFVFSDLAPGRYRVHADRDGFLRTEYGRRPVTTEPVSVTLADGQSVSDLVITMIPLGVIAGHVFDRGRPIRNVFVRALKASYSDGEQSLATADWTQTDDSGAYRLFGLAPGLYFVSAIPQARPRIEGDVLVTPSIPSNANGNRSEIRTKLNVDDLTSAAFDRTAYLPVYYPGTTDVATATPVEVRPGATATAIDLTIARSLTFRVRGRVVRAASVTSSGQAVTVRVVPVRFADARPNQNSVNAQVAGGSFELPAVPPGTYYLVAQTQANAAPPTVSARMVASVRITVADRDLDDVTVVLQPGVTLAGRVSIEGGPIPSTSLQLLAVPAVAGLGYSATPVQQDGTFSIQNVAPNNYRFRVLQSGRQPWVKSARFGADDALNGPIQVEGDLQGRQLEILLSTNTAALDALVLDNTQRPVAGVLVIAVPDFARRNRSGLYRSANTDAAGRAHIEGIAPGEYRLFATGEIEAASWQDPDVIRIHEGRGELIRFQESGKQTVTLRVMP